IANLLCTIISHKIKRHCSFSQIVTMIRLMLMYYIDFIDFMENPDKTWNLISFHSDSSPPNAVQLAFNF
ncbi:MAG: transposase, partial [Prevotellaceae bacterium]|nr:transposase [Prevotellaceae bacterium]